MPVLDCWNGEIISLEMRNNMRKELCIDTIKSLGKLENTIIYSDRGSQYTSDEYKNTKKKQGMIQSLSGTGHCYDNAKMLNLEQNKPQINPISVFPYNFIKK